MASYLDGGGLRYLIKRMLDKMYPIGSLYFSTNGTSPATIYGGKWEKYSEGRVLVGASGTDKDFAIGATGGSKTTTIQNKNLPDWVTALSIGSGYQVMPWTHDKGTVGINGAQYPRAPMDTMPPYISVNIWRRIG